jgi:hypothetical protein
MIEEVKDVVFGALAQIVPKTVSSLICNYYCAHLAVPPCDCNNLVPFWYGHTFGIPNDDLILDIGLPAALGIFGLARDSRRFKYMALGAGLAGIATFLHGYNYLLVAGPPGSCNGCSSCSGCGQAKASWSWPVEGSYRNPSPTVTTSEFLPFQTDLTY